jgi:IS30 family transposase
MRQYRRVAFEHRCQIQAFLASKTRVSEIAENLGFHRSTIYREMRRNRSQQGYKLEHAHSLARKRFESCRRKALMQGDLQLAVLRKIELRWSPEQIAGRFKRENYAQLSHETIYRFIRSCRLTLWKRSLRRYKKRGQGRYAARNNKPHWKTHSIQDRPRVIDQRRRFGDWERDTMLGQSRKMVLVCAERKSRFVRITRAKEPFCIHLTQQTKELLEIPGGRKVRSITNDNGAEFKDGDQFEQPVYYCDPQKPQQRGTVENTIGLVRQYLPKKANFLEVTETQIQAIEDELNLRPRKCLDYRTPHEVFFGKPVALAV